MHPLGTMKEPTELDVQKALITSLWLLREHVSQLHANHATANLRDAINAAHGAQALLDACPEWSANDQAENLRRVEAILTSYGQLCRSKHLLVWDAKLHDAMKTLLHDAKQDVHRVLAWAVTTFPEAVDHED